MARSLELALQRIGLDEREARVYLAALELGPSPVQRIAQRADVPRATTYLVLDDLRNKGFVTTYDEGKKTFFVAESPERLALLADEREAEVKRQKEIIKKLVPELIARGQFEKGERPMVRYYEGPKAIKAFLREGIVKGSGEIINFVHLDKARATMEKAGITFDDAEVRRKQFGVRSRVIYTSQLGPVAGYETRLRQAKYIPESKFPLSADVSVQGDLVMLVPYGSPLRGVGILDKSIAEALTVVFEGLWRNLR